MTDHALDALLAEYAPPPVPAGLAGRVVAAALALPQEPRAVAAGPRHDRRRGWLRRPLLIGGIALGLAVSGAVAATLAGIRLDRLPVIESVLARFTAHDPAPTPAPPPHREIAPPVAEPAPVPEAPAVVRSTPVAAPRIRDEPAPVIVPEAAPPPPVEIVAPRRLDIPPAPVVRQEEAPPAVVAERPAPPPQAGEQPRLQIERTERLRAARQAQIERMQRLRESRERIRRLRRD
jgi:hypothetical protein